MNQTVKELCSYLDELAIRADRLQKEEKTSESETLWKVIAELEQFI